MTITNKNIISFRCHRSMVSWVDTVVPLFPGGRAGFLRLLLVTMALEQTPPARGISKLFKKEPAAARATDRQQLLLPCPGQ